MHFPAVALFLALQLIVSIGAAPYHKTFDRAERQVMAVRTRPFLGRKLYIEQLNDLARTYEESDNLLKAELYKLIAEEAIDVYCPERFDLDYNDEKVQEIIQRHAMERYDQHFRRMDAMAILNEALSSPWLLNPRTLSSIQEQIHHKPSPEEYEITMYGLHELLSKSRDAELSAYYATTQPNAQYEDTPLFGDMDEAFSAELDMIAMRKQNIEAAFEAEYGRFIPGPPPYALSASPYYFEAPPSYEDSTSQ